MHYTHELLTMHVPRERQVRQWRPSKQANGLRVSYRRVVYWNGGDRVGSGNGGLNMSRRQCTKENPYTKERNETEPGWGWEHDAVYEVGDQETGWPGGDIVRKRCRNCGHEWYAELPQ